MGANGMISYSEPGKGPMTLRTLGVALFASAPMRYSFVSFNFLQKR